MIRSSAAIGQSWALPLAAGWRHDSDRRVRRDRLFGVLDWPNRSALQHRRPRRRAGPTPRAVCRTAGPPGLTTSRAGNGPGWTPSRRRPLVRTDRGRLAEPGPPPPGRPATGLALPPTARCPLAEAPAAPHPHRPSGPGWVPRPPAAAAHAG